MKLPEMWRTESCRTRTVGEDEVEAAEGLVGARMPQSAPALRERGESEERATRGGSDADAASYNDE